MLYLKILIQNKQSILFYNFSSLFLLSVLYIQNFQKFIWSDSLSDRIKGLKVLKNIFRFIHNAFEFGSLLVQLDKIRVRNLLLVVGIEDQKQLSPILDFSKIFRKFSYLTQLFNRHLWERFFREVKDSTKVSQRDLVSFMLFNFFI